MGALAINRQTTSVRAVEPGDLRRLLRLIDTAWRIHLRVSPVELHAKIDSVPSFLAEDQVGMRGFMIIEPLQPDVGLIIAAGLRDTWSVKPYLDLLLPQVEQAAGYNRLRALVCIGNAPWLIDELRSRGFKTHEWIIAFERIGTDLPPSPPQTPALIRTAHYNDLSTLLALDRLAFTHIWHKSLGNFSQALAKAASFSVAIIDGRIAAYEWCEIYGQHAHLTRLAVHPDFQGRGIGAQLLYQSIVDAKPEPI